MTTTLTIAGNDAENLPDHIGHSIASFGSFEDGEMQILVMK
jgi:hypothetical protein